MPGGDSVGKVITAVMDLVVIDAYGEDVSYKNIELGEDIQLQVRLVEMSTLTVSNTGFLEIFLVD